MTFIQHAIEKPHGVRSKLFNSARAYWAENKLFLLILFAILTVWAVGANSLYAIFDGPDLVFSDRIKHYSGSMIKRITPFFYLFCLYQLTVALLKNGFIGTFKIYTAYPKTHTQNLFQIGLGLIIGIVSFIILQACFMSVKTAIPYLNPYYLDSWASQMDSFLFFGKAPWTYFAWIYNIPLLIKAIDYNYSIWAIIMVGTWIYAFMGQGYSRQKNYQYIFSMILMWFIGGNILATLLASVGPCYYGAFMGGDPTYAALLAQLEQANAAISLNAVEYQKTLLWMYENPESRLGGISAIPSLHVGTSLILIFYCWSSVLIRSLVIIFNILIYIGSIVLGWHYAIDGLIIAPIAILCWYLGGHIGRKIEALSRKPSQRNSQRDSPPKPARPAPL